MRGPAGGALLEARFLRDSASLELKNEVNFMPYLEGNVWVGVTSVREGVAGRGCEFGETNKN